MASVDANTTDFEPIQKPLVAGDLKTIDSADTQHVPGTDFPFNNGSSPGNVDASEKDAKTETQSTDLVCQAGTANYSMPAALNVEGDCVVSAIRVESKFSDEDDSLGKECIWSSDQNIISNLGSTVGPIPFKHCTEIHSPTKVNENEFDRKEEEDDDENDHDDDDDSWSNKQHSGDTVWNDSDGEEDNQIGGFGRNTVLANRRNVLPEVDAEKTDSDSESKKEALKDEKHRSSWGSSIEDSDTDLPKEDDVNKETHDWKSDVQASDLQPESAVLHLKSTLLPPSENHPDPSLDSSPVATSTKCVSPKKMVDEPKSSSSQCLPSFHPSKNRTDKAASDNSEWDSSSEINDQNDTDKVMSAVSTTNVVTASQTSEQQCPGSWEEENKYIERQSNDPSPAVSSTPEDENTRNQILETDDVESVGQLSEIEEKSGSKNEEGDNSCWDDEDESDEFEKQKIVNTKNDEVGHCDDVLKTCLSTPTNLQSPKLRPTSAMDKRLQEEADVDDIEEVSQPCIDGSNESPEYNRPEERNLVGVRKNSPIKDGETSEGSDRKDQTLQYEFVSAKVSDVGDDSDNTLNEPETRLIVYAPLENTSAIVPQARVSDDLDKDPNREKIFCSPFTKDDQYPEGTIFSDEVLPQTEIDDVDLDSPDEAESIGMRSQEHRDVEGHVIQVKQE